MLFRGGGSNPTFTVLDLNKSFKEKKDKNIIHRDLKLSNILLSLNKSKINKISFKISHFGLSKLIEGSKINKMSLKGITITMSFEILKGKENLICNKSDILSLGIIIFSWEEYFKHPFLKMILLKK